MLPIPLLLAGLLLIVVLQGDQRSSPSATGSCPTATAGSLLELELPGCDEIASDTAADSDPLAFWGRIDCADDSRHRRVPTGGDTHPTARGIAQGDTAFRRLVVLDTDEAAQGVGRCELGYNWNEDSDPGTGRAGPGPTVFYTEGKRLITFASLRVPAAGEIDDPNWRVALQMKQTQPYNNLQGGPMLELQVREGRWIVISDWQDVWSAPAEAGVWTRFAFDMTYSSDPAKGSLQVHVDLNGDGDAADPGERSPHFKLATLRRETEGPHDAVQPGRDIPSHLRAGIYQNRNYDCPPPFGCHVDVDNVQVVAAN